MADVIKGGTGSNKLAAVNEYNQLVVSAVSAQQHLESTWQGDYFEATTGKVNLANDAETWLIYIKNLSTVGKYLVIDRVFIDTWDSDGTGNGTLEYYRNPEATGGTPIVPNNTLFSMKSQAAGTFLKSLTVMTGTEWWHGTLAVPGAIALEEGRMTLPPGYSFGISIIAPTGNTSMDVNINVAFYYVDVAKLR